MGLKQAAARMLASTGALGFIAHKVVRPRNQLLLLGHHRVLPIPDETRHAGDIELISATPTEFAWQVDYLVRHFEPVTMQQISDALAGEPALPSRAVAITFDDGYSDLLEHAMPILERARVPATVFVPTDFVASGKPLWFDLIAYILMTAPAESVAVPFLPHHLPLDGSPLSRRSAAYSVLKWTKTCSNASRLAFLAHLRTTFPEMVEAASRALGRALNWREIGEMACRGIAFGAHSASHPCLAQLSKEDLRRELLVPRKELETHLKVRVDSLAYPFGGPSAFNAEVVEAAKGAGYRVGISYIPGVNRLSSCDPMALLRQHVERSTSRSDFQALVSIPQIFT